MKALVSSVFFFGLLASLFGATPWYEDVVAVQEDSYSFSATFSGATGNLFSKGFRVGGSITSGKYYAILSRSDYERIVKGGDAGEQWATFAVTSENAHRFRSFFAQKGEGIKLPVWLTLGGGVAALSKKLPSVGTALTVAGVAADLINLGAKGYLDEAKHIASTINPGDRFVRRVTLESREGRPYAHLLDSLVLTDAGKPKGEILLHRTVLAVKIE